MGMLRKLSSNEDVVNEDDMIEEQYQKMFKKIARDFVHKDDLDLILGFLIQDLFPDQQAVIKSKVDSAVMKAIEYKENLNKPLKDRKKYKDIIDG